MPLYYSNGGDSEGSECGSEGNSHNHESESESEMYFGQEGKSTAYAIWNCKINIHSVWYGNETSCNNGSLPLYNYIFCNM